MEVNRMKRSVSGVIECETGISGTINRKINRNK